MRLALLVLLTLVFASGMLTPRAQARLQPEIVCVDTDIEFPVACDEDDD